MSKTQLTKEQTEYLKSLLELIEMSEGNEKFTVRNEINLIKEVYKNGYIDSETKVDDWVYGDVGDMINSWEEWYLERLPLLQK